jgi:hypothetical protein
LEEMKMNKAKLVSVLPALGAVGIMLLSCANARAAFIPLGRTNYFQNFNTLPSSGKSKVLPAGWSIYDANNMDGYIYADNGSSSVEHIYSYGLTGSSDRALGTLFDPTQGNQHPMFGADFQNTGSSAINRLNISYTGEEWRLGAAGRQDSLNFQYSLNAGSLTSGTWINAPALNFYTPNTTGVGAHDGTLAANQSQISGSIGFLNIPVGQTFWVRWVDGAVSGGGPEDGLAVDNFSILAVPEASTWFAAFAAIGLLAGTLWKGRFLTLKLI